MPTLDSFLNHTRNWFDTTVALSISPSEAQRVRRDFANLSKGSEGK